jgi:uncharacterized protein (TIGR02757 family)
VTQITRHFLFDLLEEKYLQYDIRSFIQEDPISIPHLFDKKEDIEIASFLTATLAWGKREQIIINAKKLMEWMDFCPYQFISNHTAKDLAVFNKFYYRTFNGDDCVYFLQSLQNLYQNHDGLQGSFNSTNDFEFSIKDAIGNFRNLFFSIPHIKRTQKHVSDPLKNSSCKRINLFLRWMVRTDLRGVDFGIWNHIKPSQLICPLDVHTSRVARKLGLLKVKQNNWNAAIELTKSLKEFDPKDPVKYDYALFCLGIYEHL